MQPGSQLDMRGMAGIHCCHCRRRRRWQPGHSQASLHPLMPPIPPPRKRQLTARRLQQASGSSFPQTSTPLHAAETGESMKLLTIHNRQYMSTPWVRLLRQGWRRRRRRSTRRLPLRPLRSQNRLRRYCTQLTCACVGGAMCQGTRCSVPQKRVAPKRCAVRRLRAGCGAAARVLR
jgi:hypothetical protein